MNRFPSIPVVTPFCNSGGRLRLTGAGCILNRCFLSLEPDRDDIPSKREQTAVHEAAHTVIATMIHRGIVAEVFISDTAVDVTELFDEVNTSIEGLTGGVRFHRIQTTILENGLIAYSGFFAECESLFRNGIELAPLLPQLRAQAGHDIDAYHALLAAQGLNDGDIQNVVTEIGSALKHYFDSGVWEAVDIVARELVLRGHLSGDDVLALLPGFPPHVPQYS